MAILVRHSLAAFLILTFFNRILTSTYYCQLIFFIFEDWGLETPRLRPVGANVKKGQSSAAATTIEAAATGHLECEMGTDLLFPSPSPRNGVNRSVQSSP
jgi:hypothetical protein